MNWLLKKGELALAQVEASLERWFSSALRIVPPEVAEGAIVSVVVEVLVSAKTIPILMNPTNMPSSLYLMEATS